MKKQILRTLSIVLCATTLMPTTPAVWAAGDDDKNGNKSPISASEDKTSSEEEENTQIPNGNGQDNETDKEITISLFNGEKEITIKKAKTRKTNRSQRARKRQEARKTSKRYRFLSQAYNANITKDMITKKDPPKLITPFGEVNCDLNDYGCIDIFVKGVYNTSTRYRDLCRTIINVLDTEKQKELAKIILKYLETPAHKKIEKDNFFKSELHRILNEEDKEELIKAIRNIYFSFKPKKNLEIKKKVRLIRDANDCAAILSGILFIAESAENRMFDGGKSARSILRAIISGDKTFEEVFIDFNGRGPWYPIAKSCGAVIARNRSHGKNISEYDKECFEQIEDPKYMSESSVEESSDEE